ncbi:MAG TPA: hypothetical protein DCL21_06100 [Alphaproteobacteria bacterium]|nr:hypothetical protein [Alphaproteobacteria bacterium]
MILFKPAALKSTVLYLVGCAALTIIINDYSKQNIGIIASWVFAVNATLIIAMAKDKFSAIINLGRTPEGTLLWLALAGGYPGLFLARFIFNHKTTKAEFVKPMWFLLIFQIAAVLYYFIIFDSSF